jgi:hypothetical protein
VTPSSSADACRSDDHRLALISFPVSASISPQRRSPSKPVGASSSAGTSKPCIDFTGYRYKLVTVVTRWTVGRRRRS